MNIGEEQEAIEVPIPVHPDDIPVSPETEPAEVPAEVPEEQPEEVPA